mgnify:CR=1 FL=1
MKNSCAVKSRTSLGTKGSRYRVIGGGFFVLSFTEKSRRGKEFEEPNDDSLQRNLQQIWFCDRYW